MYFWRFRKIPSNGRIIEQKMILALAILLMFFNDPFYALTIQIPNPVSSYFSVFFVVNFIIFLVFFWIILFDRIYYEDG